VRVRRARSTDLAGGIARLARDATYSLLFALGVAGHVAASAPHLRFHGAEFVASDAANPPQSGWQPQRLPDSWLHNHPGLKGIGWYRVRFELDQPLPEGMALFVPRVATLGQFWLNGSVLNPEVRFTEPNGRIGTTPVRVHLIPLPTGLFRAGENLLHARVQAYGLGGDGLWDIQIGPLEALHVPWLAREIPQRTIPQAIFVLMLVGSFFAAFVWLRDRRWRNLQFAIVVMLWTVLLGVYVLPSPPLTHNGLTLVITVLLTLFYWGLLSLFYRYSESEWHWYPRVLNVISALTLLFVSAITIASFGAHSERLSQHIGLALLPTVFLRALATVMLLQAASRTRSVKAYALAAMELLWFAGHVQAIGILLGWLSPEPFRLDPAVSLPLYLVLLFLFVERLVQDREQAARDREFAIAAERARLLHDMHDGMGSHLITALRLAKSEGADRVVVAESIEEALQDLRLIIDSLDVDKQGLVQLLGNLRYRLEPRLAALDIRLEWDVHPLDELETLSPQVALGVLRIVQEALNNAVKHANPRTITISVRRRDGSAVIGVADDGIGFNTAQPERTGRGLASMRRRAMQLGGTLQIERRDSGGTFTALHLPSLTV
jgi:signal transduction histidine kinase